MNGKKVSSSPFRFDRSLTMGLFAPLAEIRKRRKEKLRIPILMYHSICGETELGVHPYYRVVTTPEVFARHMKLLAWHGYQTVGLLEAALLLRQNGPKVTSTIKKPVVITFDDGFLDFYTAAFPVLAACGFTATVFLPTSYIGGSQKVAGKEFLTWAQVRELGGAGISFGSHSVSHGLLTAMPRHEVEIELSRSKEAIEAETGRTVDAFSYPYAFPEHDKGFVAFLREAIEGCGYRCAVTTGIGTVTLSGDALFFKRLPVNDADDDGLFLAKLNGGYDWLHSAQYAAKKAKRILGVGRGKNLVKWSPPQQDQ
ncbi:MAG: polysaccharide deacetylase family protein [Nitrospiraceae bacterium]|nr:polysaccharide deacetylase family protein [Nitrospiraceae bacterium]